MIVARQSPNSQVAKAIACSLNRWDGLARFLDDCSLCMTNNAAKRTFHGSPTCLLGCMHPAKRIAELLPWNWTRQPIQRAVA